MQTFSSNLKKEFFKHYSLVFVVFAFCMSLVASFFVTRDMQPSSAASLSSFKAGNIISDAVMSNYNTMSIADIQNFLDSKNKCDNRDYNLYLQYKSAHPTINWHWEDGHFVCLAEERFGDGEVIGSGMTAAEIIYDAAQKSRINPQVLLVLLQKESSLITDKVPNDFDYRKATGYGCPDTAACDSKYYGFKNQIYRAAELFRYVLDHNSAYYPAGRTVYVGYHPSSSCGGTQVYIENRATAALYQYTPYQPNSAALNAGYSTGNSCSAYGNRNFYLYFNDWFGNTQAAVDGELITIPDGEYTIASSVANDRALGLSGSNAVLASIDMANKSQRWQFVRDASTGYYQITNVATGKPLITQTVEPGMGTNVLAGTSTTCSKNWKIYRTKDNYLTFESACVNGIALDVKNGSSAPGTAIQTYITDGTKAQKWGLIVGQTLEDGIYTIVSGITNAKAIDIAGGSDKNGANIQIWDNNKTIAQKWQFTYNTTTNDYTITNPINDKALDVYNANMNNGTNIHLYSSNNTCAQRWQIVKQITGQYVLISSCSVDKVMDLSNASTINRSNIQLWSYDPQTSAQRWSIVAMPIVEDGEYKITSKLSKSEKAIDLSNARVTNGANIQLWNYDANTIAQRWELKSDASGYYNIYTPDTDKNLDIYDANMKNGSNIHLFTFNNTCAQKWLILESGESTYTIFSTCDKNYALDVSGGQTSNGTNIQLWKYDQEAKAQKWSLTPLQQTSPIDNL